MAVEERIRFGCRGFALPVRRTQTGLWFTHHLLLCTPYLAFILLFQQFIINMRPWLVIHGYQVWLNEQE
jgi:hypothetical protein